MIPSSTVSHQTSDFTYSLHAQSLPTSPKIYLDKYCTFTVTYNVHQRFHARLPRKIPTSGFPYILPSSVSCNSFICHSYENWRGVYQQFPFWNSPRHRAGSSSNVQLQTSNLRLFTLLRTLLHVFAFAKISTPLFSIDSALFLQNTGGGWGMPDKIFSFRSLLSKPVASRTVGPDQILS
jgi:hypothetical protein